MAYNRRIWQDHVTQYNNRYTETQNQDGSITHTPVEGTIIQQGTPQNAANFNNMEEGIFEADQLATEAARMARINAVGLEVEKGERIPVNLTNSAAYPFNNSVQTVSIAKKKTTPDYYVDVEVVSSTGGGVGTFKITDKLLNGFKIAFTGAATAVSVICRVKGGV